MSTPERDWEAEFAEIAARLRADERGQDASAATPRRSAAHELLADAEAATEEPPSEQVTRARPAPPASAVPGFRQQWRVPDAQPADGERADVAEEETDREVADDGDFVPPQPDPLDTDDPGALVMLGCFVIGPLWLLYLLLFDRSAATIWWSAGALLTLAGFVLAVARQPKNRDEDDPSDDGARL